MKRKLGLLLGAVAIYYIVKGNAGANLTIDSLKAKNFKFNGLSFSFDLILLITNLSPTNLTINGLGGTAFVNGKRFATTVLNEAVTIPRNGAITIAVDTYVPLVTAASIIYQEVKSFISGNSLDLVWQGSARALGLSIPLQNNFKINRYGNVNAI
jgi:hypothetical protein